MTVMSFRTSKRRQGRPCQETLTTTFRATLGGLPETSEALCVEPHISSESATRKQVLVADDDESVCALLDAALRTQCDVVAVYDAETALDRLSSGVRFDAIVSDFMLPGISGLEFVSRVREGETLTHIPILMISGHASIGGAAAAAGADAFLDKPFTIAELRSAIDSLLELRQQAA